MENMDPKIPTICGKINEILDTQSVVYVCIHKYKLKEQPAQVVHYMM